VLAFYSVKKTARNRLIACVYRAPGEIGLALNRDLP